MLLKKLPDKINRHTIPGSFGETKQGEETETILMGMKRRFLS
ncbi:hypothetical protein LptCag_1482 [Leptospirillum ferriphilum]|uniref:Uncharacterized protein n=1 Tax=Leptospirillum ferriphilum TaxID=178606 RepID=A0A094WDQ2_9BACT|nr:hypothetical protein LptCag_1482 [Leptospirillum ferriphilum]